MSNKRKQIRIAIVSLICIVIIYFGILFLKNASLRTGFNSYVIEMSDVSGLSYGADVLANGMNIGSVRSLSFNSQKQLVEIIIELNEGFELPIGTKATLSKDMLGSPKVKLLLGSDPSQILSHGDTIKGMPLLDIMSEASDIIPAFESLLPKIDSLLYLTQSLLSSPALSSSLNNISTITANLAITTDNLNNLLALSIPTTINNANLALNNINKLTNELSSIDFASLSSSASNTLNNLDLFTNRLNDSSSSLGKLLNEEALYQHLDTTIINASLLLEDLRLYPKRYVHFSIW